MSEIIFCVGEEHFRVIRVRSVRRICKPEILPYHYSMPVAGFVELNVSCLTHPVAHDSEIHVRVVIDSYVIFSRTIVQIVLTESPVASTSDESTAIDIQMKDTVFFVGINLSDSYLEVYPIGYGFVCHKFKSCIIEILLAITAWPPESWVFNVKLGI